MWKLLLSDSYTYASSIGYYAIYSVLYSDEKNHEIYMEMLQLLLGCEK